MVFLSFEGHLYNAYVCSAKVLPFELPTIRKLDEFNTTIKEQIYQNPFLTKKCAPFLPDSLVPWNWNS